MPAPNASFILSMLNPYQGFRPDSSGAINLAQLGEQRVARQERSRQFDLENARSDKYFGLQEQQFKAGQANELRDKQISAYTRFQAAVDSGDTEQADLALSELRILGVGVEKYGGQAAQNGVQPPSAQASPMDAYAPPGTKTPQQPAPSPKPMSAKDAQTSRELGQLSQQTQLSPGLAVSPNDAPSAGYSMDAMDAPSVRPRATQSLSSMERPKTILEQKVDRMAADPGKRTSPLLPRIEAQSAGDPGNKESPLVQKLADAYGIPYLSAKRAHSIILKELENGLGEPDLGAPISNKKPSISGAPESDPMQAIAEATGPRPAPARTNAIKGQEPAPAGEATPEQSLIQGYRLTFKDASGQERVVDIDPKSIAERQRQRVAGVFDPLVQSAQTPQEKQAALQAKYTALQAVGTVKPEAAVKMGMDFYEHTLDRGAKEKRAQIVSGKGAGAGYGGMDTSKGEQQRSLNAAKYVESISNSEQRENNIKGIREELAMGQDLLSKANSPTGLGQFASKATLQKMLMKGALSDKDVARLETATGVYNRVVQWVNNWSGDGQVPKDVLDAIKLITVEKNKILRERLLEAGNRVESRIRDDPFLRNVATPEEIDESANREFETTTGLKKPKTKRARGSLEAPEAPAGKEPKRKATGGSNAAARRLLGK